MMRFGKILLHFSVVFSIAFLATAAVTALYGRIFHGACGVSWENAVIFGLIFGIVMTWQEARRMDRDEDEEDNPYD